MPQEYRGPFNVLSDGDGVVIPVTISPADIAQGGLIIDVTRLIGAPSGAFGDILGLTVDASNTSTIGNIASVAFLGTGISRNINGGVTQVYRGFGPCKQILITNLGGWIAGTINILLWNTTPANELQYPIQIAAGSITISGPVTIAGGNVNIAHEALTIVNSLITINVPTVNFTILPDPAAGTIRSIDIRGINIQAFKVQNTLAIYLAQINPGAAVYYVGAMMLPVRKAAVLEVVNLPMLGIVFTGGLRILTALQVANGVRLPPSAILNVTIGYQ